MVMKKMEKNQLINLLDEHLREKRKEYLDLFNSTPNTDLKLKYMYLGRANSYLEVIGFLFGVIETESILEKFIIYEER